MKITLIVPDGVGIRNYLYSSFIDELVSNDIDVIIYHNFNDEVVNEIKKNQSTFLFKKIPNIKEGYIERILRESLAYARLLRFKNILKNETILSFWNNNRKGVKQKVLYSFIKMLGRLISLSNFAVTFFDKLHLFFVSCNSVNKKIKKDLVEFDCDLLLNLHQRAPLTTSIIHTAKQLRIKAATVIFSWDNVPKARLISRYDKYFVWSKIMKEQLCLLYPEINEKQIDIVGSPQFEFYDNTKFHVTKEEFFYTYNLDLNKKTICYSANDTSLPYDPDYIEDICFELMKLPEIERPQIIFRQCPVDLSDRFDYLFKKYNEILKPVKPLWENSSNSGGFSTIFPKFDDIGLLVNTVLHSDLAINVGSTIAHDFSALNKPTIYLNYNTVDKPLISVETIYKFEHFKSMNKLDAVIWINNTNEINEKIIEALNNPTKMAIDRLKWFENILAFKNDSNKIISKKIL